MTSPPSATTTGPPGPLWRRPWLVLGAVTLLIHLVFNNAYGVFRDELYFIVCGQHPDFGYIDQPPLAPLIAGASHALFGPALLPLRLAPALAMAATVALTAELARILSGGRFAQWLAGLCVLTGSVFLVNGLILTTDLLQTLTWLGCAWSLVRLGQTGDQRWWLAFGAIVGVSLTSKYLIVFYLAGLGLGVLATPLRGSLGKPWIYLGGAIAAILGAPSIVWQAAHGWPFLELGHAGATTKNLPLSPLGFLGQQILFAGMAGAPVWIAGLWRYSVRPPLPEARALAIAYPVTAMLVLLLHGKAYYLTPIYPSLFAGGALAIEGWLESPTARAAVLACIGAIGLLLAPFSLPILPVDLYMRYADTLGLSESLAATERFKLGPLPQQFADMQGWPEMAAKVAAVYDALPPADRARAVFFGRNYGEAGAIDVFGRSLGLPPAISGHNNYYLWGPGDHGSVLIVTGSGPAVLFRNYGSAQMVGRIDTPTAMPYETDLPIYVLRDPKIPLAQLWPALKHFE